MNLKQAQTVLSDLLMKCEEENIALPQVRTLINSLLCSFTCCYGQHAPTGRFDT